LINWWRSTISRYLRNALFCERGASCRPSDCANLVLKRDIELEHGKITVSGGGYGEMASKVSVSERGYDEIPDNRNEIY